jgi:hypothetical protein
MLFLYAFYMSRLYLKLVTETELTKAKFSEILTRTVADLSRLKYSSPILKADHYILCNMQRQLQAQGRAY